MNPRNLLSLLFHFVALFLTTTFNGCNKPTDAKAVPFDLTAPQKTILLPDALLEISGLDREGGLFYAVMDEAGILFVIDPADPSRFSKHSFSGKGDFEGIEYVNDTVYCITSEGVLFAFRADTLSGSGIQPEKIGLPFKKKENFEGLGYSKRTSRLMLVAKEDPENARKNIYSIQPGNYLDKYEAVYTIDSEDLLEFVESKKGEWLTKFTEAIAGNSYGFNPSGIAEDPLSGDIYIISYPLPQLLVMDANWQIKELQFLSESLFIQPEGICFDKVGNLYISNEGKLGKANILQFNRHEGH